MSALEGPNVPTDACSVSSPSRGWRWADLMRPVFELDVLACPRCGGHHGPHSPPSPSADRRSPPRAGPCATWRGRLGSLNRWGPLLPAAHPGGAADVLRTPWGDGTTHVAFSPGAFLARLAVLIPRPRVNLLLYYGVLAPRASWRQEIVLNAVYPLDGHAVALADLAEYVAAGHDAVVQQDLARAARADPQLVFCPRGSMTVGEREGGTHGA